MGKAIQVQPNTNEWEDELRLFSLEGWLPSGQALSVNTNYMIVSLVEMGSANKNPIQIQRSLTETNMRLLLPLLESPHYCPHEILRASLFCSYQELLAGFFSPEEVDKIKWQTTIIEQHALLQRAQFLGTWKKELKPLYKALSELRPKLHPFGLEIAISTSCSAYTLMPLPRRQTNVCSRYRYALDGVTQ